MTGPEQTFVHLARHLNLVDVPERVDSVPETKLRLLFVPAAPPEPEVDIRIHDADGMVAFRIDLGYRAAKLAFEYDGRWHADGEQPAKDERRRHHLETEEGWRFEVFVAKDVFETPRRPLSGQPEPSSRSVFA